MSLKNNDLYEFEGFRIDFSNNTLWFADEFIALPPKVMETLCLLVKNQGKLMSKDELMSQLWADTFVEERNLTQNIFTIRKTLSDKAKGKKFIETIPRRGYRFVAEVFPVITEEESVQINHTKQTRITAEGFVSKAELAETVREIAKTVIAENGGDAISPKQISDQKPVSRKHLVSNAFLSIIVFSFVAVGATVWIWQNDFLRFRQSGFVPDIMRSVLDFERLTDSGKTFYPTVSPDKQFAAYVFVNQNRFSIRLRHLATGSVTIVVEPNDNEISRPKFSADGNYIFYRQPEKLGGPGIIYRIPIFGGTPRRIVYDTTSDASVSPDGEWLAFVRIVPKISGQQLIICRSADGSDEKVIAERAGNEYFSVWGFHPAWSPDGKKLLVGLIAEPTADKSDAGDSSFVAVSVADGSYETVNMPKWNTFLQAEWMPGGESILFLAQDKPYTPFQIWQVDYPSGTARRITNDSHDYRYLSIAPDASFLLTTQEKTFYNLWLVSALNPAETKQLTDSSEFKYGVKGISWTPDGKHLIYTLTENVAATNLWAINVETQEKRLITFDKNNLNWFPRVLPDGKSVIFSSNRKDGWHIWQTDLSGANLRQITNGVGENNPNISADGNWLVYASPGNAPNSLWKKSLTSDDEPIKLVNSQSSNALSPDAEKLIVSHVVLNEDGRRESKYGLMPFEPTEKPIPLDFNPYFGGMDWKKDASGFYWVSDGRDLNNIWFYSIEDKSQRQVTNFDNLRMRNVSVSPDGNTLATARGETVSNVFKISGFD